MEWKVLSSFSMASPCGSMSQRTLAAPDIFYSLPSSTWPGFKHLQSIRNHIFNSCPNGYLGGGTGHWGSLEDTVAWKEVMEEKMLAGPIANVFATGPCIVWLEA